MRRVEIVTTCDACAAWQNVETSQDVETLPVGGQTLDLCPEHKSALRPLLALVAEWGATEEAAPKTNRRGGKRARARRDNAQSAQDAPAPVQETSAAPDCPVCHKELSESAQALREHLKGTHHVSLFDLIGPRCPLCGVDDMTGREIGHHGRIAHELSGGIPALIAAARAQGDPLGVIESRTRAVVEAASS